MSDYLVELETAFLTDPYLALVMLIRAFGFGFSLGLMWDSVAWIMRSVLRFIHSMIVGQRTSELLD